MMLIYHRIEYIGQRAYDFVKKQLRLMIFAEIKRRNLLRPKVTWPKLTAQYYGEIWCADFTHVELYGQVIYIAIVLDCHSCYYLGYSVSATADVDLVKAAFLKAVASCQGALPERYLVNDRGNQYKAELYRQLLKGFEIEQKFIPNGTPWNNGEAEVGMKDIKALFYRELARTPRKPGESIVSQAQALVEKIFKELNEIIPRPKLEGVTPRDVVAKQTEAKIQENERFIEERRQQRRAKTRIDDAASHIRSRLEPQKWSDRHLKNLGNLLTHNYHLIVPEAAG